MEKESKTFYKIQVLRENHVFWDKVRRLGRAT